MNNCTFIGNLTRDPEIRTTQSGVLTARFTVAVQRRYKDKSTGKYESDFIRCTAFRSSAEVIQKYFQKGSRIGIQGSMHTDSYEKDGVRIPTCECWVDSVDFCNGARKEEKKDTAIDLDPVNWSADELEGEGFLPVDESELPF